jgi:Adenylate and Guanylate cyclase catalytic domain
MVTAEGLDGERKTVTALFADIKGSTELMRDLDPEEARAIVDPVLQRMMEAVNRYGGYVEQSTGDGIFAIFGAPVAHEDHPQRTLHAVLAMQEEFARYADRLRVEGKIPVEARVGVNTGEVVVRTIETRGHTEYTPVGHVQSAGRMQTAASAGSIAPVRGRNDCARAISSSYNSRSVDARSRICETLATAFATCGKNRRRPLRSRPFGMNSQAGQNSHNPLRLAEIAPFDAVNRKHA